MLRRLRASMRTTRRVLDIGPVAVEVPAVAGVNVFDDSRYAAWSAEDLLTVQVGRYSVSITDEWLLVFRKYEYADH